MHVLIVALSGSTSPSGVCRLAANLSRGMLEQPSVRQVTMLTGAWQESYFRNAFELKGERLAIHPVDIANRSISRNLWHLKTLPTLAHALRADIVHLTFPVPVIRPLFSVPVVMTLHDLYPFDMPENFGGRAWLNRAALRLCLWNADQIVCISQTTRVRLGELFPVLKNEKCGVVLNSAWPRPSQGHVPLPVEVRGGPFLLCVAQHRANKNLSLLLKAFHRARQQDDLAPKTKLIIAGSSGPETKRLQKIVEELGLGKQVLFLHNIPDALLYTLYAACELVVVPSLVEGFGAPAAEALAAGCRVVCSDIPALREVGCNACFYFDPTDSSGDDLLAALQSARSAGSHRDVPATRMPKQLAAEYYSLYSKLLIHQKAKVDPAQRKAPVSGGL